MSPWLRDLSQKTVIDNIMEEQPDENLTSE